MRGIRRSVGQEGSLKQRSVWVIEGSVEGEELEEVKRGIVGRSTGARLGDARSLGRCGILAEWVGDGNSLEKTLKEGSWSTEEKVLYLGVR